MPMTSMVDLISALARNDFESIKGMPEGHDIDFKTAPYVLDKPKGQWELAKDVAAFANASGGCLVIGVKAERLPNHVGEVAVDICPVKKAIVDVSRHRDLLAKRIVPSVEGIQFRWYPDDPQVDDGILLIEVPPQRETVLPFLVTKMVDPDGKEIQAFGWPKRNQDRIEWVSAERIQHILNSVNSSNSNLGPRATELAVLATGVGVVVAAPKAEPFAEADLYARANQMRLALDANTDPCIVIQACPPERMSLLAKMFGPAGLKTAVRNWQGIRQMGFDLTTAGEPTADNGNLVVNGMVDPDGVPGWQMRLDTDGLLQLALPFRWHFLGWALRRRDDPQDMPPRISSLVLVEIVLDLFRFLRTHLDASGTWNGRVIASSMQHAGVELYGGYRIREMWGVGRAPIVASSNEYAQSFACPGPAERDAFECLAHLYPLWQFSQEVIPFTKDNAIDPQQIITLRT